HDDAAIRLMRDEEIDLARLDAIAIENAPRGFLGVAHRELEHGRPILLDVVHPLLDRVLRRRPQAAARGHAQGAAAAAVDEVLVVDNADVLVVRRFYDNRTSAVA